MSGGSYLATFAKDPLALDFARSRDIQAACLCLAARDAGLPVSRIVHAAANYGDGDAWLELGLPHGVAYLQRGRILVGEKGSLPSQCHVINAPCRAMIVDKMATKIVLGILGLPTPEGMAFASGDSGRAVDYALSRQCPVCIKPVDGSLGEEVFPNLSGPEAIRTAVERLAHADHRILVEDHVPGEAVRFFFVYPKVVGIRLDRPANVVGDGRSTIAQLLLHKNRIKRLRTSQPPIRIGPREQAVLVRQGFSKSDVPALGRMVLLRDMSNASQGGDSITATAHIHPDYAREIERLCLGITGLRIAAVDAILLHPGRPAAPEGYAVLELNASPGMVQFRFPWEGPPVDLAPIIVDALAQGAGWPHA